MSAERADVVVVGAGLAGSAAAWALTRRGRSVVVFEAFEPGHTRGSSHGSARIFRRAYPDPLYVRLTGHAGELWRQLESEAELATPLLRITGGLDYGRARDPEELHAVLTSCGVPAELLAPAAAAERWPDIAFDGAPGLGGPVMFHPEAGVIDPERAMAAMRTLAASRGAEIHYGSPVTSVETSGSGAIVHTPERSVAANAVIVAAGPWVAPLIGDQVPLPPLTVTQQQAFHFAQRDPEAHWPIFIYKDELSLYGLPGGTDAPGMIKMGEHGYGATTTADTRDGIVNAAAKGRLAAFVRENLPGLVPEAPGELTCLYTSTANEDFILDRRSPFVISSACSGHGAKFAPLIGEIAADLACGKDHQEPRFTLTSHLAQSVT
jgi:sarcosine oxidase